MVVGVSLAVALLSCVLGGLRAAAPSGDPPTPEVRCWCASYPEVTLCSWPEPPRSPPTHYVATCSERHNQTLSRPCRLIQPGSPTSFLRSASSTSSQRLWLCHLPNLKLLTDYIINVTAVGSGGSSSHLSSFMLEEIVKPDPPVNVRVSPLNVRSLLVEWSPPPTWANLDILPLKYQILYRWEDRGTARSRNLGPLETTRAELKGLVPGRPYLFQVCAKDLLGLGECSDWSPPVPIRTRRTKW